MPSQFGGMAGGRFPSNSSRFFEPSWGKVLVCEMHFLRIYFFVSVESYRLFLIGAPVARGPNGPWIQCNVGLIFGGDMVLTNSKFNQQIHKKLSCVLLDSIQVSQPQKRRGLT